MVKPKYQAPDKATVRQAIKQQFKVNLLKTDMVNAFALASGDVYVTRGMLDMIAKKTGKKVDASNDALGHILALAVLLHHGVAMTRLTVPEKAKDEISEHGFSLFLVRAITARFGSVNEKTRCSAYMERSSAAPKTLRPSVGQGL